MDPSTVALIFYFSWGDSDPQSFLPDAPDILPNLVHDTQWPESAQQTCIKEAIRIKMKEDFSVSPSPLLGLLGLELGWTGLGLGLGGLGTKGLGTRAWQLTKQSSPNIPYIF